MPLIFYYCPYCEDTKYTEEEYLNGHIKAAHFKEYKKINNLDTINTNGDL